MFIILKKELKALLKDRRAVILGLLMPIILITVFSLAFGGINNKSEEKKIQLLVCDEDKSPITKQAIAGIDSIKMLEVYTTTTDSALALVKAGKYPAALIFRKGFNDSVKAIRPLPWELKYDATQAIEMGMMQQYLAQSLFANVGKPMSEKMILRNARKQFSGMDSMSQAIMALQMKKSFETNSGDMDKLQQDIMKIKSAPIAQAQNNDGLVQALAGTAVMMLLFSLTAVGGRLLEEKENGTLKRLLYSPLTASDILTGKIMSAMVFAICQLFIMLTYSSFVFGLVIIPKLGSILLLVPAIAFACSGFGMFLASFVKSREQLQSMSTLCILIMSVIGGSMVPSFLMPHWMQNVGHASINYWAIQGFYDIFSRGIAISDPVFLEKVGILTAIGAVLTAISFSLFRKNVTSMA